MFAQYHGDEFGLYSQRLVRSERYKFVYDGPDVNELYDLQADPAERNNLIDHPEYRETRLKPAGRLVDWTRQTDDPIAAWTGRVLASDGDGH